MTTATPDRPIDIEPTDTTRSTVSHDAIENLSHEDRAFAPSPEFAAQANATAALYDEAAADRLAFWEKQAHELQWETPWHTALDWSDAPFAKWFDGGRLNVAVNCVDRHVAAGHGDQVAYHFEGEPGDTRDITYAELLVEVSKAANALESLGVKAGDRVAIYLPMIPEAAVAMLACARIGAVHSVVFGGFSAEALRSRIDDAQAVLVITCDGGNRKGKPMALKPAVDEAVLQTPTVRRTSWWSGAPGRTWSGPSATSGGTTSSTRSRKPMRRRRSTPSTRSSSSTRAVPQGSPRASCTPPAATSPRSPTRTATVFDLKPDTDVFWCTADIGWVTGHSYVVYGPLANRATSLMYEGTPDTPHNGRWWELVEKYKRLDPLHRADRDPHLHEVGRGHPRPLRPVVAARARLGR